MAIILLLLCDNNTEHFQQKTNLRCPNVNVKNVVINVGVKAFYVVAIEWVSVVWWCEVIINTDDVMYLFL